VSAEALIPWRAGCPHRERAFEWLRERLPYPVRVGEGGTPWVKAHAIAAAAEESSADIVVVHDADVWCDGLPAAVEAVRNGEPWAIPHGFVYRLTEASTPYFMGGTHPEELPADARYWGFAGGGIVVLRRTDLLRVPLDPRFVGWGGEDESWAIALEATLGKPWRGNELLIHLWHPPQERASRRYGSLESRSLVRRYRSARRNPALMEELLAEVSK
jgi:hypothetical protein